MESKSYLGVKIAHKSFGDSVEELLGVDKVVLLPAHDLEVALANHSGQVAILERVRYCHSEVLHLPPGKSLSLFSQGTQSLLSFVNLGTTLGSRAELPF